MVQMAIGTTSITINWLFGFPLFESEFGTRALPHVCFIRLVVIL
jgi:hypothetical protein